MLPIFANLAFNTAPTVFPISVSVSDPQLIRTVRHQLDQAELEPGTDKSIFRSPQARGSSCAASSATSATTMNRPTTITSHTNSLSSPSGTRRRSRATPTTTTTTPNDDERRQQAPPSTPSDFLSGLVDKMFCCSYSGTVPSYYGDDDDNNTYDSGIIVVSHGAHKVAKASPSFLNGTPLTEKALDNFPAIERARKVRSSTPTSFTWNSMDAAAPAVPPKANNSKFFVLDEKPDDHKKRLSFYKQQDEAMTRTSTATTASMERSASVSSASMASSSASLQSWNTLPTQPSEDESSCHSAPSRHKGAKSGQQAGTRRHRQRHQRRLTDPQLAEQLLMEQLREKLMQHGAATTEASSERPRTSAYAATAAGPRNSRSASRSVYHQPSPVE